MGPEGEKKTVTIRGIDKELYERILVLARETGKTVGEIINEAMRLLLTLGPMAIRATAKVAESVVSSTKALLGELAEEPKDVVEITGLEVLEISKQDLESIEKPVIFKDIKKLVIGSDVPFELFNSKVKGIVLCGEVLIPKTYPKLLVATKCKLVKRIAYSE